jgi:hypothetical protein
MTVVKTFAVFRLLQSVVSRSMGAVRYLLGRRPALPRVGDAARPLLDVQDFQEFARGGMQVAATSHAAGPQPPSWKGLALVFLVTFVGLPMVVSKVFSLLSRKSALELEWSKDGRGGEEVVALHDFAGESARELSFNKGDVLTVVNKFHPDWWEAAKDGKTGIIPSNFVESYVDLDAHPSPDELKSVTK